MRRVASGRGSALVEFALAWPIALFVVLFTVQAAVWASEVYAARAASLAGARAGTVVGGNSTVASDVARRVLQSSLIGVVPVAWCPGATGVAPPLWVCALDLGGVVEVDIGGSAPAIVPLVPGGGLPVRAHVVLQKEAFAT